MCLKWLVKFVFCILEIVVQKESYPCTCVDKYLILGCMWNNVANN